MQVIGYNTLASETDKKYTQNIPIYNDPNQPSQLSKVPSATPFIPRVRKTPAPNDNKVNGIINPSVVLIVIKNNQVIALLILTPVFWKKSISNATTQSDQIKR